MIKICAGPGHEQTAMQKSRTSFVLKEYWRSPEGVARRAEMRAGQREARLRRRKERAEAANGR